MSTFWPTCVCQNRIRNIHVAGLLWWNEAVIFYDRKQYWCTGNWCCKFFSYSAGRKRSLPGWVRNQTCKNWITSGPSNRTTFRLDNRAAHGPPYGPADDASGSRPSVLCRCFSSDWKPLPCWKWGDSPWFLIQKSPAARRNSDEPRPSCFRNPEKRVVGMATILILWHEHDTWQLRCLTARLIFLYSHSLQLSESCSQLHLTWQH